MVKKRIKKNWWDKFVSHHQVINVGNKRTLILMPNNGPFAGYRFWYPSSLVKYESRLVRLLVCDDIEIRMMRRKGEEKVISGKDFIFVESVESEEGKATC